MNSPRYKRHLYAIFFLRRRLRFEITTVYEYTLCMKLMLKACFKSVCVRVRLRAHTHVIT